VLKGPGIYFLGSKRSLADSDVFGTFLEDTPCTPSAKLQSVHHNVQQDNGKESELELVQLWANAPAMC
jgi:hypothetical protein